MFTDLRPPYDVILADPPWAFSSNSRARPGRNARRHYDTMSLSAICAMPVREMAAPDALLLLWTTAPFAEHAFAIVRAWGFRYVSQAAWVKSRIATGYWARNRHEPLYICRRGRFPCRRTLFPDSVIPGAQREHSRKPEHVHERVDALYPEMRKLELFARQRRAGWDAFGNEADRFTEGATCA